MDFNYKNTLLYHPLSNMRKSTAERPINLSRPLSLRTMAVR
jgi:hypothetical protein